MGLRQPFFSIIIPTYGRPRKLATCLQSLTRLDYPRDRFGVIVVDDGSETPLESVIAPFRKQLDLMLLMQANSGPAAARNTGAAHAKGEFLAFTDDDCTPASDWLQTLAVRLAGMPDCAIGGRTVNALPDNLYSTASQMLVDYLYEYYNADPNQARFLTSNNLAVSAGLFQEMGGFETTFPLAAGEDRELCDRWLNHGLRMTYAPEALVYHAHTLTFHTFWKQHFNYGRGASCFHRLRARRGQGRVRLEPLSFYMNLLRHPLSRKQGWRAGLLAALLVVSQGANAAGFVWEGVKPRRWIDDRDKLPLHGSYQHVGRAAKRS
jgi:glycosyltransferase involved in cell wall biosynthesis